MSAGLFTYPVLMAGDILLYQTDVVPVGDTSDNTSNSPATSPSVSTRATATRSRSRSACSRASARARVDLQEPTNKMLGNDQWRRQGTVLILDPPDVIRKKFRSAVTDSGSKVKSDPQTKPGVCEPDRDPLRCLGPDNSGGRTGVCVERLRRPEEAAWPKRLVTALEPVQRRYYALRADEDELFRRLSLGAEKARRGFCACASG